MPNSILPYGWMLFGALAFATMGTLIHALGPSCDWQIIALSRTALVLIFATALTLQAGAKLVFLRPSMLWVRSFGGSISLVCTFYALTRLPVADVLTLTNVFPIWVALLSWPILREAPNKETWIAIACGIFGVILVQQPHFRNEDGKLAAILALLSSFTTAISMLGLHRLQEVDPRAIVAHFSGVSLLVCLASLLFIPNSAVETSRFDNPSMVLLLGVGICATIGQIFLTKAFAAGPPAKVSVIGLTQVGFAIVFDVLVWGQSFSSTTLVGMVFVMAPTAWLLISQGRAQVDDL
ncbi:MAG: DMT family transporter [Planctomycetia bacterium]|nr:DMT family transporter [Planctomycetia bacterium]